MNSLIREIERLVAALIAQETIVANTMTALADRIRGDDTPETYAVDPDGSRRVVWQASSNDHGVRELARAAQRAITKAPAIVDALAAGDVPAARRARESVRQSIDFRERIAGEWVSSSLQIGPDAPIQVCATRRRSQIITVLIEAMLETLAGEEERWCWVWLAQPARLVEVGSEEEVWIGTDERLATRFGRPEMPRVIARRGDSYNVAPDQIGRVVPFGAEDDDDRFERATTSGPLHRAGQYAALGTTKDDVLAYLRGCPVVLAARTQTPDRHDPAAAPITVAYSTDGAWIWSSEVTEYLDRYDLELPPAFLHHIALQEGVVPVVQPARLDEARSVLGG